MNQGNKLFLKKGTRYYSLKTQDGKKILHIHHTGSAKGEIHLDKNFWKTVINIEELINLLKNSYEARNLGDNVKGDIRIVRTKR